MPEHTTTRPPQPHYATVSNHGQQRPQNNRPYQNRPQNNSSKFVTKANHTPAETRNQRDWKGEAESYKALLLSTGICKQLGNEVHRTEFGNALTQLGKTAKIVIQDSDDANKPPKAILIHTAPMSVLAKNYNAVTGGLNLQLPILKALVEQLRYCGTNQTDSYLFIPAAAGASFLGLPAKTAAPTVKDQLAREQGAQGPAEAENISISFKEGLAPHPVCPSTLVLAAGPSKAAQSLIGRINKTAGEIASTDVDPALFITFGNNIEAFARVIAPYPVRTAAAVPTYVVGASQ